jgi:hypothetical protein
LQLVLDRAAAVVDAELEERHPAMHERAIHDIGADKAAHATRLDARRF